MDRYRRLGFTTRVYDGDARYGFVDRGSVSLVSLHVTKWLCDAEAVHAEWAQAGVSGRLGEPHDTEYVLREFGYVDPDGTLHRVGSTTISDHESLD
jgi:hypothetical protein